MGGAAGWCRAVLQHFAGRGRSIPLGGGHARPPWWQQQAGPTSDDWPSWAVLRGGMSSKQRGAAGHGIQKRLCVWHWARCQLAVVSRSGSRSTSSRAVAACGGQSGGIETARRGFWRGPWRNLAFISLRQRLLLFQQPTWEQLLRVTQPAGTVPSGARHRQQGRTRQERKPGSWAGTTVQPSASARSPPPASKPSKPSQATPGCRTKELPPSNSCPHASCARSGTQTRPVCGCAILLCLPAGGRGRRGHCQV